MRYFYDCEFVEDGSTIDLISIGIVAEDGREYYAVNANLDVVRVHFHDWLMANVWPHLPRKPSNWMGDRYQGNQPGVLDLDDERVIPKAVIAAQVWEFLTYDLAQDERAELWAYYGTTDHVTLAQLWGPMVRLPPGVPMWTRELMQLWELAGRPEMPAKPADAHDALVDATWNRALFDVCNEAIAEANYRQRYLAGPEAHNG